MRSASALIIPCLLFFCISAFGLDVTFPGSPYSAGTTTVTGTVTAGANETPVSAAASPADKCSAKLSADGKSVEVKVEPGFTGTIVVTITFKKPGEEGEDEYTTTETGYAQIGGKCDYCYAWTRDKANPPEVKVEDKNDPYTLDCDPNGKGADGGLARMKDLLGGSELDDHLSEREKEACEKYAELQKKANALKDAMDALQPAMDAAKAEYDTLNDQMKALQDEYNTIKEALKKDPNNKTLRDQQREIIKKMRDLSPALQEKRTAYYQTKAEYDAAKYNYEKAQLEADLANQYLGQLAGARNSSNHSGWHLSTGGSCKYQSDSRQQDKLVCSACAEPDVMYRYTMTAIDVFIEPFISTVIYPEWKQAAAAGDGAKEAWGAYQAAVKTHELGHRKIYDEKLRKPAVEAATDFLCKDFIGEVHVYSSADKVKVRKMVRDLYTAAEQNMNQTVDNAIEANSAAQEDYENKTKGGTTQDQYKGYDKKDNITYDPDIPLS